MKLLRRLLGLDEAEPAAQVPSAREDFSDAQDDSRERVRVTLSGIGRTCVNVDELDLFGTSTPSPNGRLAIVVGSIINGEPSTGAPRDGAYAVLEDRLLLAHGTVERPHDAKVADNGAFVMNDWMHGGELAGRFLGFRRGGQPAFAHLFSANLACNGISSDGRYAACQTLSSPGSPDDTIAALFDLESGQLLARFKVESGTAEGFEFDSGLGHVHALLRDGDRETYDLDGRMVDRPAWVARRIARGDLTVIGGVVKTIGEAPDAALAEQLLSGLRYGATHGDAWTQARAERLRGELLEILALPAEALEAYDAALALDPQVGVARRSDKLRRKLERPAGNPAPRQSRFERQAARLGIRHELIRLDSDGPKRWRFGPDGPFRLVEEAALDHFAADGWSGAVAEGGLMLTVIKAASFANLAQRNADTFIEALYHQNVAFEEDRFDRDRLIETVRGADLDQLARNWKVISANAGTTPAFYPRVEWRHVMGLFETLGNERLAQVAEIFATAPYDFRAGWPDLTLWRNGAIRFVEVKSPSDQMHASQTWLISKVLVPLGFDTVLLEVAKSPTA